MNILLLYILLIGYIIQGLFWIITDPRTKAEKIIELRSRRRSLYIFLIVMFVNVQVACAFFFPMYTFGWGTVITGIGIFLWAFGMIIAVWAKITMKKYWAPPGGLDTKRQNTLLTTGPFAFTRNPIYVGILLSFAGFPLALRSYGIILLPLMYFYFKKQVLKEEILLEKQFKQVYTIYKKKTPRFIF